MFKEGAKAAALAAVLIASAYFMTSAVQSHTLWWLGWVTLLPLFLAIRLSRPITAIASGALWGSCLYLFSVFGDGAAVDPGLRSFILLTAIPGLYAGAGAHITRRVGFSPLLLGLGWVAVEFALQPLALHQGLLAGTLGGGGLFVRTVGNLGGYVILAFLIAYVCASLLSVLGTVLTPAPRSGRRLSCGDSKLRRLFPPDEPAYVLQLVYSAHPRAPPA